MHGNYPDACKIRAPEISLLQTRNMHGPIIRIISYVFLRWRIVIRTVLPDGAVPLLA